MLDENPSPWGFFRRLFGFGLGRHEAPVPPESAVADLPKQASLLGTPLVKVLVVDDDAVIRKTMEFKLGSLGYAVRTASGCSEALGLIRKENPDLMLIDVSFPAEAAHDAAASWNGLGLMGWLHRLESTRETPIIIMSGDEKFQPKALEGGALAFFSKPVDFERLSATISGRLRPIITSS